MKPHYNQPHNIRLPEEVKLNEVQQYRFREIQHARQKYEARRMYNDRRRE